jgi:ABC-type branched-subunit amino acid transport system permease subunit
MNAEKYLRSSINKGLIYSIIVIFMMMIGFHVVLANLMSKFLGVQVLRGSIPEVVFMGYVHILLAFLFGWNASDKNRETRQRIVQGLVCSLTTGLVIALFSLLLNYLVEAQIDIREYLTAFSADYMRYFVLNLSNMGTLVLFIIYGVTGFIATSTAIIIQTARVQQTWQNTVTGVKKLIESTADNLPVFVQKYWKFLVYGLPLIVLLIMPLRWGSYINFVTSVVGVYIIAGIGLNIMVGLSGQLMLGFAAFMAMGAYSMALLNAPAPHGILLGFWPSLLVGVVMAMIAAVILGLPIMRLRGDYLAIVTLGFGEIIRILLRSDLLVDLTGGPRGIHAIQGPTLFGRPFNSDSDFVYLIFFFIALSIVIYFRLANSRTGRAWLAINEDPIAAQATGVNLKGYKLLALIIGAAFAGLVGGIAASRNAFTGPNDHSLMVSINVLSLLIVGGMNSIPGIFLGAFALRGLPEILREVETYRQLAFGILLIVMMLVRPKGLWPSSRPVMESIDQAKVKEVKEKIKQSKRKSKDA